jgi:hypothetical protein
MSVDRMSNGGFVITGESIALYRLMTLRRGIMMEAKGLRLTRGRSCLSIVKSEFGWKGNRDKILSLLEAEIGGEQDFVPDAQLLSWLRDLDTELRDLDTIDEDHDLGVRDLTDPFTGEMV